MTSPWAVVSLIAIIWLVSIGVAGPGTLNNVLEQGTEIGQAVIEKGAEVERIVVAKNFETKEIVEQKSSEVIQEIGEIILDDDQTMYVGIGVIILIIIIAGIALATRKKSEPEDL
jgi:NADH:ubiquinone oxidoreductase subunit 6 (subunit J)